MGRILIEITTPDWSQTLANILSHHLSLNHVQKVDKLTFRAYVNPPEYEHLTQIPFKCGETIRIIKKNGWKWNANLLLRRPVLIIGVFAVLFLTLWIPSRIFFVNIKGNNKVSEKRIAEAASQCGVGFGVSRREINSEKIKNAMLQKLPELRWVGVTTEGAVATIKVREGKSLTINSSQLHGVSSLVATRDGVIEEYTAIRGNPLCKVGQSVKKGQILISGYTNCGISLRGENAQGEIFARTEREISAFSPDPVYFRGEKGREKTSCSVVIGKKLIKIKNDSGIIGPGCVKLYKDYHVKLPGNFYLPITFRMERIKEYSNMVPAGQENPVWIKSQCTHYLCDHMVAGKILDSQETLYRIPGAYQLNSRYSCIEMIGKSKSEEIVK